MLPVKLEITICESYTSHEPKLMLFLPETVVRGFVVVVEAELAVEPAGVVITEVAIVAALATVEPVVAVAPVADVAIVAVAIPLVVVII